jgi:hypothetical protein
MPCRPLALTLLLVALPTAAAAATAGAAPRQRLVRFTASFAVTREFRTTVVPASSLVGCTFDETLMPLEGTTGERDTISATGSLDYRVQQFGFGRPSVSTPSFNPLRGRSIRATIAIERSAAVLRPAPCDDDAPDRAAQPIPLAPPCPARATERPTQPLEPSLRTPTRWAVELPIAGRCDGKPGGDDPLFPRDAPVATFALPSFARLMRRARTVVPVRAAGDCSSTAAGDYRLDCRVTIGGTLTLTRRR